MISSSLVRTRSATSVQLSAPYNASINACRAVARLADKEHCQEPPPSVRF